MRENLGEVMHKKYTAHKIREMEAIVASGDIGPMTRENVALMLKQAAEMLDRLDEDIWRESTREKSSAVGDAAKMREACENIAEYAKTAACHTEDTHLLGYLNQIAMFAEDALSAPPRNCDRPECSTTKAAQEVWRKEDGGKTAYYEWLLETSTAKGGAK